MSEYYTISEVETITNRTYNSIRRWVQAGTFPSPIKIRSPAGKGGPIIWPKKELDDWLKKQTTTMRLI